MEAQILLIPKIQTCKYELKFYRISIVIRKYSFMTCLSGLRKNNHLLKKSFKRIIAKKYLDKVCVFPDYFTDKYQYSKSHAKTDPCFGPFRFENKKLNILKCVYKDIDNENLISGISHNFRTTFLSNLDLLRYFPC